MAKNKKIRTKIMLIFAAIVLLQAFLFMPVPYYLEMPGSAESISDYIKIDGKKDKQKGKYMLVYVSICRASPASFLASFGLVSLRTLKTFVAPILPLPLSLISLPVKFSSLGYPILH